jgi:metal-responsive CopG/Arc/MetJ family transcriptional regulator
MTTLSISVPATLAQASQDAAQQLGVSRTQFIRLAITHELKNLERELEQEAMAKSMTAMKNSKAYLLEAEEITSQLNSTLPKEKSKWWAK